MQDGRIRVAVIYGGRNSEHGISVVSAGAVIAALDPDRYDVVPVGITTAGTWVLTADATGSFELAGRTLPAVADGPPMVLPPGPQEPSLLPLDPRAGGVSFDVAFPVLHGRYGEDGAIQGLFEMAGVPYVGAGVLASATAMDKEYAKKLLAAAGLNVAPFVVVRAGGAVPTDEIERLGLPVFVKPARAGSSVGISKVTSWDELPEAIRLARTHDSKVLVEAAIAGREIEIGVLEDGDGRSIVSVPAEIRLVRGHDWYDFEAKYLDDACEFDVPAKLDDDTLYRLREAAITAFEALGCEGLARVDFFVADTARGEIVVNELNTMPGFTPISMFPRMWAASGLDYPALVDHLVQTALRRGPR